MLEPRSVRPNRVETARAGSLGPVLPRKAEKPLVVAAPAQPKEAGLGFDKLAPTVFHQTWWLNTVTGGDYSEAVAVQAGQKVGSFPYSVDRSKAGPVCAMPPMTHFLGPAIDEGSGAACNRVLRRAQVTRELLDQVKGFSGFWQKLHRGTPETLVYQEQGFATSVQFTFEVAPAPSATLWRNMRDKTRNVIRRAQESHVVADLADLERFAAAYTRNVASAGERSRYSERLIEQVCQAATARQQGRVIGIEDAGGIVAAIFYVWDAQSAYYLLSTRRQDAANGAVALLIWTAMQDIAARGLIFDFEGVPNSGSALFFTGFGGEITPRYVASRFSLRHKLVGRLSKSLLRSGDKGTYI